MIDNNNVKEKLQDINSNFDNDMKMQKLREELSKSFENYKNTMRMLAADAPVEALCLPRTIEKLLLHNGCLRIYDIVDLDFAKIEGLGPIRLRHLTTSVNQFFSMM